MSYSRYSLIFLICFLSGCFSSSSEFDYGEGLLQSQFLIEKYGQVSGKDQDEYLNYLEQRLVESIPERDRDDLRYRFILINSDDPLAFSPGGGFVLFSKGLVLNLSNEAELAFVLAHELGHQHLGHTRVYFKDYSTQEEAISEQQKLELEADEFAIGLVALAGYDPRLASFALLKTYRALPIDAAPAPGYPDLNTRLSRVKEKIDTSGWRPPGTIDRRDFRAFRQSLELLPHEYQSQIG